MAEIVLKKVRDTSKLSIWRMEVYKEAGGNVRFVHVYLLELPRRARAAELLRTALLELGHSVILNFEEVESYEA